MGRVGEPERRIHSWPIELPRGVPEEVPKETPAPEKTPQKEPSPSVPEPEKVPA